MLDNYREHIFDGPRDPDPLGERKFVDAPEVERTAERAVTLNITAAECAELGPARGRPSVAPWAALRPRALIRRASFGTIREKRERDG